MRSSIVSKGPFLFAIAVLFLLPVFLTDVEANDIMDPIVDGQVSLEVISEFDSNPALLRCVIPWEAGEPSITVFSYRTGLSNWTAVENWRSFYSLGPNCSYLTFPLELEWGVNEEVMVRITDLLGSNTTIGASAICSRPPVLSVDHVLDNGERPASGMNRFSAEAEDPDGQELAYRWIVDGVEASREKEIEIYLHPGSHCIEVEVTDGQFKVKDGMNLTLDALEPEKAKERTDLVRMSAIGLMLVCLAGVAVFTVYAVLTLVRERTKEDEARIGPADDDMVVAGSLCEICMKELREGQSSVRCRCGAQMHQGCGRREGVCPKCGREILI